MSENIYCRICDLSFSEKEAVQAKSGDFVHWICPCCGADVCPPGDVTTEQDPDGMSELREDQAIERTRIMRPFTLRS